MVESTLKQLKRLLETEGAMLKGFIERGKINKEELKKLKEIQEKKRELLSKLLELGCQKGDTWKDVLQVAILSLQNKDSLISLLKLYGE